MENFYIFNGRSESDLVHMDLPVPRNAQVLDADRAYDQVERRSRTNFSGEQQKYNWRLLGTVQCDEFAKLAQLEYSCLKQDSLGIIYIYL